MVVGDDRRRAATGIAGLLRTVRAAVDPKYRPIGVRIARCRRSHDSALGA